jgi:hypothetical protein
MDNNELFVLFPELRHGLFEAKIKKPMESYLHASSNISMNALNTIYLYTKSKIRVFLEAPG